MVISKSMVALSAILSAGIVAAIAVSPSAAEPSAALQVSARFPAANEMFAPMSVSSFAAQKVQPAIEGRKNDRMPLSETCAREDWPYLSQQCLISADGGPVRKVQRVITIERRIGESTSELARLPVADLAQR
jgi:hypothetical protein